MKRRHFFFMVLCFLLLSVSCCAADEQLTVFVYMTGADLESVSGAASADLEEMIKAVPADEIRLAVLTGGAKSWQNGIPSDQNVLWQVTPDGLVELEAAPKRNMGDPEVLRDFLRRGTELFPADHYALILWDHGAGPLNGVCFDEQFGSDGLTLEELKSALADSPFSDRKLMFIGFDACLMSSIETASAVAPYAEYMIASQEPLPAAGWNYAFLSDPDFGADGLQAGTKIVDSFAAAEQETAAGVTLSCLDLSGLPALEQEIDRFFGTLAAGLTRESYAAMAAGRNDTKALGNASPMKWDLVDLLDLTDMLGAGKAADGSALRDALKQVIVCQYANEPYVCGLSIYAPFTNKTKYMESWSVQYDAMAFSKGYRDYVKAFASQWMGKERTFWRDPELLEAVEDAQKQRISLALQKAETSEILSARLLILEEHTADSGVKEYRFLNEVGDDKMHLFLNQASGEGVLYSDYHQEALYLLDENDKVIAGPLGWRPLDDKTGALGLESNPNSVATFCRIETPDRQSLWMYLTWVMQEDGNYLPGTYYLLNEELDLFSVSSRALQDGDMLEIGGWSRRFPEKDAFYDDWEPGETVFYFRETYKEGADWHARFMPLESSDHRVAVFEMTDLQGNPHLSKPIPLVNLTEISLLQEPVSSRCGDLELSLNTAKLFAGADAHLRLECEIRNHGNRTVTADVMDLRLNQTVLPGFEQSLYMQTIRPGEAIPFTLVLSEKELRKAGMNRLNLLGLYYRTYQEFTQIEKGWFNLDLSADLTVILPDPETEPEKKPVFQSEQDGFILSLYDFGTEDNWGIKRSYAEIRLKNSSGLDRMLRGFRFRPNGGRWYPMDCDILLPADTDTWIFRVYSYDSPYWDAAHKLRELTVAMDVVQTTFFNGSAEDE